MKDYRIIQTAYASGRTAYTVEFWQPEIAGPEGAGRWIEIAIPVPDKQAGIDFIEARKAEWLDATVVSKVELDDKGKAK